MLLFPLQNLSYRRPYVSWYGEIVHVLIQTGRYYRTERLYEVRLMPMQLAWCGGYRAFRVRLKVLVGWPWGRAVGGAVGPLVWPGCRHSSNGRAGWLL